MKGRLPFGWDVSLDNSVDSYCFWPALRYSVSYLFLICQSLLLESLTVILTSCSFGFIYFFWCHYMFMMTFPSLGNSDHVSVSFDFPINSKQDTLFHCIAYIYSRADWDGLCDHLRDVPWENIFKISASALASEFCEWV